MRLEEINTEILAALQSVLPYLSAIGTNGNHWISLVEAAITKAQGGTK